ncbi:MAG: hypothetical protein J5740_00350 [Bacteroidales bacterium]|nr:hypothetical protein [Bacteroidales bacterium]
MVKKNLIDLKTLNLEELNGVVSLYPWFALARAELCRRMAALGEGAWSDEKFAEQALYLGSRRLIFNLVEQARAKGSEAPVGELIEGYFAPASKRREGRQVFVVGGDYFSAEQYEGVRLEQDNIFSSFAGQDTGAAQADPVEEFTDFCTESLAKVYLDQGYKDKAKEIYSKLMLRYPEKSVYFAALIEKIDQN